MRHILCVRANVRGDGQIEKGTQVKQGVQDTLHTDERGYLSGDALGKAQTCRNQSDR